MRSSCIRQPERQPLLIIRKWQLEFCEGDRVAAALMSHLEYWHNYYLDKVEEAHRVNDILSQQGAKLIDVPTLVQPWTRKELIEKLMHITKTPEVLRRAEKLLIEKGALKMPERERPESANNYLFCPDAVNAWLNYHYPPEPVIKGEFKPKVPSEGSPKAQRKAAEPEPVTIGIPEELQSAWTFAQTHDFWCMRITNAAGLKKNMQEGKPFRVQFEQWKGQPNPEAQKHPEREKCPHCENGVIELYKPGELKPEVIRCPHGEKAEKIITKAKAKGMCTKKENSKLIAKKIMRET